MAAPRTVATACLTVVALLALGACGARRHPAATPTATTLDVYSSLPLAGPLASAAGPAADGIKLALEQAHATAGPWRIHYISLDDAAAGERVDRARCAADARAAAADPRAIAYVGEFDSACTEVSLPILNQVGIPMVDPASTYVGLTTAEPGAAPGEPWRYYPSGRRTYLRIVPRDSVQAAADLLAVRQAGCTRVALANDGTRYGVELARLVAAQRALYGVAVVSSARIDPAAPSHHAYVAAIRAQGADCFYYAGRAPAGAVQIAKEVHVALPLARLFVPDRLCTGRFTNPLQGGVPAPLWPLIQCTAPPLAIRAYPGGAAFLAAYTAAYHLPASAVGPYAIFGYEAMRLVLDTVAALGRRADSRTALVSALFAIRRRDSVLGRYGFDGDGDTTLTSYGLYRVGPDGNPRFERALTPARVV